MRRLRSPGEIVHEVRDGTVRCPFDLEEHDVESCLSCDQLVDVRGGGVATMTCARRRDRTFALVPPS